MSTLEQDALVSLDDIALLVESRLVTDQLLELLLGLAVQLVFLVLDVVLDGGHIDPLLHLKVELLLSQL